MLIFDCNGVLVDSEAIAATVASQELTRAGFKVSPEIVSRFFAGRRPTDMIADVEVATKRKLPADFYDHLSDATMRRLRAELRATPHMEYALTWLRGPKCVCSSSPHTRVRMSLESTGLYRFFEPYVFSASDVARANRPPTCSFMPRGKWAYPPPSASWWKIHPPAYPPRPRPA